MVDTPAEGQGDPASSERPEPAEAAEPASDGLSPAEAAESETAEPGAPGRASVAASRRSGSNRLTLILGGITLVVMAAVIVLGFWMNARANAVPEDGYGQSKTAIATVDAHGVVTVGEAHAPLVLDIFEDALDPDSASFEQQFGQQIAKAVDDGRLAVRYRMVDFLNVSSTSGNYSTRAYVALLAVARIDGSKPGVWMHYRAALFDPEHQPTTIPDGGKSDLDNAALAALAGKAGASAEARQQISSGALVAEAHRDAVRHRDRLKAVWKPLGAVEQTPTVAHDGSLVPIDGPDWLTDMLDEQ